MAIAAITKHGRTEARAIWVFWAARAVAAGVWLYNGLWLKLLDSSGRHEAVVSQVPGWAAGGRAMTVAIGLVECVLAGLVLLHPRVWTLCVVQIALLVGMNIGGLAWARELIPSAADLIVHSATFVALILCIAELGERHEGL
jgi:hypothetical protein